MQPSLYSSEHISKTPSSRGVEKLAWWNGLPNQWRDMVLAPSHFDVFREPELAATRAFGYEPDGSVCFYSHEFILHEERSDDGEEFYLGISYAERLLAWHLRDGRWLISRAVSGEEGLGQARAFYSFSETMPR